MARGTRGAAGAGAGAAVRVPLREARVVVVRRVVVPPDVELVGAGALAAATVPDDGMRANTWVTQMRPSGPVKVPTPAWV